MQSSDIDGLPGAARTASMGGSRRMDNGDASANRQATSASGKEMKAMYCYWYVRARDGLLSFLLASSNSCMCVMPTSLETSRVVVISCRTLHVPGLDTLMTVYSTLFTRC